MNILWLTNVPIPEACSLMKEKPTPFGGWLVNASAHLAKNEGINLSIAFPKPSLKNVKIFQGAKITYFAFPAINSEKIKTVKLNPFLNKILNLDKPDIVHIFGTEYAHTFAMLNACNAQCIDVVISIQGLVSIFAKHYMACVPVNIQNQFTFRDMIKIDNLKYQQRKFVERGHLEIEALQKVKHIIGRTTWDRACTSQINPIANYHFCNETLRSEFYKHTWNLSKCEKQSVFVSQGSYPIKGLHFMIEAMPLILRRFPNAKLYVAGYNITSSDTLRDKLKRTSYGKYIKELISRFHLGDNIVFTGVLDEEQICARYLQSHVFASPSSIENSPNALGEAMLLGVPCVASDVGGVSDMLKHKEEGFVYQADAPYMLAHYICEIFADDELALQLSAKCRRHALRTHDREENTKQLIKIYKTILHKSVFSLNSRLGNGETVNTGFGSQRL